MRLIMSISLTDTIESFAQQKVVIGDDSGSVACFQMKRGEAQVRAEVFMQHSLLRS